MSHKSVKAKQRRQSSQSKRTLITLGVALIGALTLILAVVFGGAGGGVPDFSAPLLSGETVSLSQYRGQVVMLNFWATWCPPCRAEMPAIQEAYDNYQDEGFVVLAINNSESPREIRAFADSLALNIPIVLDVEGRLQRTYGLRSYPTSMFIDAAGAIYATHNGMLTDEQLTQYIEQGLAQTQ